MAQHPYVPQSLHLPDFQPNFLSVTHILSVYGLASLLVVSTAWFVTGKFRYLRGIDRLIICWWAFTGLTHMVLEGYFVFTPDFYKKTSPIFLAEAWKEYCKGDSRYAARDSSVVVIEGITAVLLGPASLLAVYAIATQKSYRHPLQLAICLGQLYGCLVYFFPIWLDGTEHAAGPFYFWFYFIFMNYIWVVIPSLIALRSWRKIAEAFEKSKTKKM